MSMQAAAATGAAPGAANAHGVPRRRLPMVHKLAYKNLFHDRLSLLVTLVGIVFSVVLVAVQLGIFQGTKLLLNAVIDHAEADLWVVPYETKSFDDPYVLTGREKQAILSTPGVARVNEMLVSFVNWRKPSGGLTVAAIVGIDDLPNGKLPWDIEQGSAKSIMTPNGVAVDAVYFGELGVNKLGDRAEINGFSVTIAAVTRGIRSFTTVPYVFTTIANARAMLDAAPEQASFIRVKLAEGADPQEVRKRLSFRMPTTDVITQEQFRERNINRWLFGTGAGVALIAGTALGIIVGIVIVAQTLYSSTKDHLNEFATLRALGASAGYINRVILIQAILSAVLGYMMGMMLSLLLVWVFKATESELPIVMTAGLAGFLFALTVGMCILAAIGAIFKVIRIDPAAVFSR